MSAEHSNATHTHRTLESVHDLPLNQVLKTNVSPNIYIPHDITMGVFGIGEGMKGPSVVIIVDHYPPVCVAKTAEHARRWAADFTRAAEELEKRAKTKEPS